MQVSSSDADSSASASELPAVVGEGAGAAYLQLFSMYKDISASMLPFSNV